jgi:ADP-ribose pyrophosphatase
MTTTKDEEEKMVIEEITIKLDTLRDAPAIVQVRLPKELPEGIREALKYEGLTCLPGLPPEADEPMIIVTRDKKVLDDWFDRVKALRPYHNRFQLCQILKASDKPYQIRFTEALGKSLGFEDTALLQLMDDGQLRLVNPYNTSVQASLHRYEEKAETRPDAFEPSEMLPMLAPGSEKLADFARTHKRTVGEIFANPPFWTLESDAVEMDGNTTFYPRLVYPQRINGVVTVARQPDGRICLLKIYRHAPRAFSWELPRGARKLFEATSQTASRELREEVGVEPVNVSSLGTLCADTSVISGFVEVFQCDIPCGAKIAKGYEQIDSLSFFTEQELKEFIAGGNITDGYTLSAMCLFWTRIRGEQKQ